MSHLIRVIGLGILAIALVAGVGISGDTKKDKDKEKDTPKDKVTHKTPAGWKILKLTGDQKKKVYAIQDDYGIKINDLKAKIRDLETQEMADMVKVLTAEQKAQLTKALIGEEKDKIEPKDKADKDKVPDKDKAPDKKDK
jgi:Spy/CpxP family protein refolding chaperone